MLRRVILLSLVVYLVQSATPANAQRTDPTRDPNWASASTYMTWELDTNNDGAPDVFKKCGADSAYSGPCSAADWANVMMVKVYLLTRNVESSPGYADEKTYDMGLVGTLPAFTGDARKYKRHVYSTPIRLVNVSDRREMP